LVRHIIETYERQKEQSDFLNRYRVELLSVKEQIERIKNEKSLATSPVIAALLRLEGPEERLFKWLTKVDLSGKKAVRRFVEQLVLGNAQRKRLEEILGELTRVKLDLILAINITNAERVKKIEEAVISKRTKRSGMAHQGRVAATDGAAGADSQQSEPCRPGGFFLQHNLAFQSLTR
jgi:hypothetical protein